jgi:hypothetical protein
MFGSPPAGMHCCRMAFVDLRGQKFGRLTVISRAETDEVRKTRFLCRCQCGSEKAILASSLRSGRTTSCGCLARELSSQRSKTHGETTGTKITVEYRAYSEAKKRCNNPNSKEYQRYGARGIQFLFPSYESFLEHLGRKPDPSLSLDRIDSNKHYEPGNVRWASVTTQRLNQGLRSDNRSAFRGVVLHRGRWEAYISLNHSRKFLGCFSTAEDAAVAYDRAALELHLDEAKLNFPQKKSVLSVARRTAELALWNS